MTEDVGWHLTELQPVSPSDRDILEMGSIGCFFSVFFFGWAIAGLAVALGFNIMNEEM